MKKLISILIIALFLPGCSKKSTEPEIKGEGPKLLAAPAETDVLERGIDAIPEQDAIQIQWELGSEFKGFKLYKRSQSETEFKQIRSFGAEDSVFIDSQNITFNTRYYYYLVGRRQDNHWSEPSDTVDYMLIAKAFNLEKSVENNKITFHWQFHDFSPEMYFLRLYDETTEQLIWLSEIQPSYTTLEERVDYNWDGRAQVPNLEPGRPYRWRIDIRGPALNSGSESNWHRFSL